MLKLLGWGHEAECWPKGFSGTFKFVLISKCFKVERFFQNGHRKGLKKVLKLEVEKAWGLFNELFVKKLKIHTFYGL